MNEKSLVTNVKVCLKFKSKMICSGVCQGYENNILKFEGLKINFDLYEAYVDNNFVAFTAFEFKLFYFLTKNQGKIFIRSQIFEEIYEKFNRNNLWSRL